MDKNEELLREQRFEMMYYIMDSVEVMIRPFELGSYLYRTFVKDGDTFNLRGSHELSKRLKRLISVGKVTGLGEGPVCRAIDIVLYGAISWPGKPYSVEEVSEHVYKINCIEINTDREVSFNLCLK